MSEALDHLKRALRRARVAGERDGWGTTFSPKEQDAIRADLTAMNREVEAAAARTQRRPLHPRIAALRSDPAHGAAGRSE